MSYANGCYDGKADKVSGICPTEMAKKMEPLTLRGEPIPAVSRPPSRKGARKVARSASRK